MVGHCYAFALSCISLRRSSVVFMEQNFGPHMLQ